MSDPRALLGEFGIEAVGKASYPKPGQTRAVGTVRRIIKRHGETHMRDVLTVIADTRNNKASLEAEVFGAVSDLLLACKDWYEADPSKFLAVFDACPIGELQAVAHDLRGFVPLRHALAGLIYERVWRVYGPLGTQPDLLDSRRMVG